MVKLSDSLYLLISKLSNSEKRHFSKYCKIYSSSKDLAYINLYRDLEKSNKYDKEKLTKKFGKNKLSSLSKHLYEQLLASLRNFNLDKFDNFELLKTNVDIKILTKKKMYIEAEALLDKNIELSTRKYLHFLTTDLIELKFQYLKLINKKIDYKLVSNTLLEQSNLSLELSKKKIKLSYYIGNFIDIYEKEIENVNQKDLDIIDKFLKDPLFKERDPRMSITSEKDRLTNYVVAHSIKRNYKTSLDYSLKLYDIFHDKYKNQKNNYLYINNVIISATEANNEKYFQKFIDIFLKVKSNFVKGSIEYEDITMRILNSKIAHFALNKEYHNNYKEYIKVVNEYENLNLKMKDHYLYSQFMISRYLIEFKAGNYNNSLELIQEYYLFTKSKKIYLRNKYEELYKVICLLENKDFDVATDLLRTYKRRTSKLKDNFKDIFCNKIKNVIENRTSEKLDAKIKNYDLNKLNVFEKLLILWTLKYV